MSRGRGTPPGRFGGFARRWGAAVALGVITVGVLVAYFTPVLGVTEVQVSGTRTVPPEQVRAEAAVPLGESVLRLDTGAIRDRLGEDPRVAAADVSVAWPSSVQVAVTERVPAAFVAKPGGVRLADANGVLFADAPAPPPGLLEIRVPAPDPVSTRAAMGVLAQLPPELRAQVQAVSVPSARDVHLQLAGNREVVWGEPDDSARKAAVLPLLMTRQGHVYDVTSPSLATVS